MLAAVEGHHAATAGIYCRRLSAVSHIEVYSACAAARSLLRAEGAAFRVVCAMLLDRVLEYVVISCNICRDEDGRTAA